MSARSLIVAIALLLMSASSAYAQSIHLLLIGDTNDRSIGQSVVVDLGHIQTLASKISKETGMPLKTQTIKGADFKEAKILSLLENVRSGPKDMVFFYYSGHGYRTRGTKTKWPLMYVPDARNDGIDFQLVIQKLESKNPRMIIAFVDACNSYSDSSRAVNLRVLKEIPKENYKKLFVDFSGRIYASGSTPGQYSFGDDENGGLFTDNWLRTLDVSLRSSNPTWKGIMEIAGRPLNTDVRSQPTQNPQYEIKNNGGNEIATDIDVNADEPDQPDEPDVVMDDGDLPTSDPSDDITDQIIEDNTTVYPNDDSSETDAYEDEDEFCGDMSNFLKEMNEVYDSMPSRVDLRKKQDRKDWEEMVESFQDLGGDRALNRIVKRMKSSLRQNDWKGFKKGFKDVIGYFEEMRDESCE